MTENSLEKLERMNSVTLADKHSEIWLQKRCLQERTVR